VVSLLPADLVSDLQLARHGYHVFPQGPYFAPRADGVAAVPLRCAGLEQALLGSRADPGTLRLAADAAAGLLDPADDLHTTAGYRKHVAGVLLRRAVAEAYGSASGAGRSGQGRR